MCTARPACRKSPCCWAMYSGAFPTPRTAATVIEEPAGACGDPAELPLPGSWQPASSTTAAAQPAAIRARPLAQRRTGLRPAGTTFIAPWAPDADSGSSGRRVPPERTSDGTATDEMPEYGSAFGVPPVYLCRAARKLGRSRRTVPWSRTAGREGATSWRFGYSHEPSSWDRRPGEARGSGAVLGQGEPYDPAWW